MAREVRDVFLDKDGEVVEAKDATTMRRVVIEDGEVVERSIWFAEGAEPAE